MKENYYSQEVITAPTAFVTKSRQRVKQFNDNIVYLKNGDEFEIELFNPTKNKVLAKIKLNGKTLGSGIILRPGERVFLERYFDEARKFLFETYEIDANDSNAQKAIEENGKVDVEFYAECIHVYHHYNQYYYYPWVYHTHYGGYVQPSVTSSPTYTTYATSCTTGQSQVFDSNTISYAYNSVNLGNASGELRFGCSCNNMETDKMNMKWSANINPKETGRVEKGSTSNQRFTYDNTEFNNWYTWKVSWAIMPESQKAYAKEDLKIYCVNCGTKRKKVSHKFCYNCGQKF